MPTFNDKSTSGNANASNAPVREENGTTPQAQIESNEHAGQPVATPEVQQFSALGENVDANNAPSGTQNQRSSVSLATPSPPESNDPAQPCEECLSDRLIIANSLFRQFNDEERENAISEIRDFVASFSDVQYLQRKIREFLNELAGYFPDANRRRVIYLEILGMIAEFELHPSQNSEELCLKLRILERRIADIIKRSPRVRRNMQVAVSIFTEDTPSIRLTTASPQQANRD